MRANGFLAIDVSKGYGDFVLLDQDKHVMEDNFQLQDNKAGRKQLGELIAKWFSQGLQVLHCGVESTGGYESNWYSFLRTLSPRVKVARLNAKAVKAVSEAGLKRTITDEVSAENIAVYLISFPEKIGYGKSEGEETITGFQEGRKHYTYVRMLQKQKVQLTNQLEKLLYQYFGEMLVYCRHGIPGWLLRMLSHYPCATAVTRAGEKKLSAIKGISIAKAKALMDKANGSEQSVTKQMQHVMAATSKEILHKEQLLRAEKDFLSKMNREAEEVKLLTSIPCIGEESAVALMMEIEDITRFESTKKLTAYFGVHPTFKQSGDGTWAVHMSKKGRGEVRAVLYMAAMTGIRHNVILQQIYTRFRAKGMKHYQAMGVVMHKLLRIIYGVLKSKTKFDPAIDEKNVELAKEKEQQNQQKIKEAKKSKDHKKYRYQSATTEAPISRVTAQKRKKQAASQAS
jgi:transposase